MTTIRALRWWTTRLLGWLVILSITAVLLTAVLVPRVTGATPYSVVSSSMEPAYPPGTLVVVRPTPFEDLRVGDVVTYQLESGEPAVATHRVESFTVDMTGERRAQTRGDANPAPDREPVREVQVQGRLWYHIPYVGYVNDLISGQQRQQVQVALITFLVLYSAYMFTSAARDRRQRRLADRSDTGDADETEAADAQGADVPGQDGPGLHVAEQDGHGQKGVTVR